MIKKYKIACCVLGAIVLVLILALAITVFVFAGNIKAADGVENASGDIADTISEAVFLTTSYVGMVIFVFAIIVGCLLLLYLIAYAAFYAQIYSKGKCRVDFIAYDRVHRRDDRDFPENLLRRAYHAVADLCRDGGLCSRREKIYRSRYRKRKLLGNGQRKHREIIWKSF